MNLTRKLAELADGMSSEERACLKLVLGNATAGLIESADGSCSRVDRDALLASVASLASLQPHRNQVPQNGIVYRGRPDFMTDSLLADLQAESTARRHEAIRFHDHLVVSGAPGARDLAFHPEMAALMKPCAGPVTPTTKANYLYYDEPGLGIEPHVDNDEFSLNAILMLHHDHRAAHPSALVVFPLDLPPERIILRPGEMIVMFADSVVHSRERVAADERVSIVACGFATTT